jgi:hypothetical protein
MGIAGMDLVHKDSNSGMGFTYLRPDFEKFFPTTIRITMIQVSQGATYDPAGLPRLDGGMPPMMDSGTRDSDVIVDSSLSDGSTGAAGAGAGGATGAGAGGASSTGAGGQSAGTGGQATSGSGGNTSGSGSTTVTGAATTSSTTNGSGSSTSGGTAGSSSGGRASGDGGGCNCSLPRSASAPVYFGHLAVAALSFLGASRRRSRKPV